MSRTRFRSVLSRLLHALRADSGDAPLPFDTVSPVRSPDAAMLASESPYRRPMPAAPVDLFVQRALDCAA